MNPRYQIFVSSTFRDLEKERERVIFELIKNGYIAVGMEQFQASDEEQMEYIRPLIDQTDYYVLIVKGRYGALAEDGISYTEKEFKYAREKQIPVLSFLYKDFDKLPLAEIDDLDRIKSFRETVSTGRMCHFWRDKDELVSQVKDSVFRMIRIRPGVGWVRGDQALDPNVYKELEATRKENEDLRRQIASYSSEVVVFPENIAHGNDAVNISISYYQREMDGISFKRKKVRELEFSMSWDQIFDALIDDIFKERDEYYLFRRLAAHVASVLHPNAEMHPDGFELNRSIIVSSRYQFQALGLITTLSGEEGVCWSLTEKGRRYISSLKAIRRGAATPPAPQP